MAHNRPLGRLPYIVCPRGTGSPATHHSGEAPRGRWWTEDVPDRYSTGDRVESTTNIKGAVFNHVGRGTQGRVTDAKTGLLGGDYVTVEFDNGYTEEVRTEDVKRASWW